MASDPPDKQQKTAILQDMPPEVQSLSKKGAPPPASSAATMMMDAAQHPAAAPQTSQRQMVVPTMMRERPSGALPPVRPPQKPSTIGRWLAGPIIAALFAGGTYALAGVVMPLDGKTKPAPLKPQGHLKLQTDPPGASVTVDGKLWTHFTPTTVDGDIGSTLHVGFKLDGYTPKEADVYVSEGEHPFNTKLEKEKVVATPPVPVEPKEHHHHSTTAPKPKEEVGKGMVSVTVHPWAIVYVNGTRLRQTPVLNYELPAGKYTIELVNEGKGRREKIQVQLKPGEKQEITREWDK